MSWAIWPALFGATVSMWLLPTATEEGADGPPAVVTLAPSPTPTPVPPSAVGLLSSLRFGGGLDGLMPTPTPAEATPFPPEADTPPLAPYYPASTVEYEFGEGWTAGGGLAYKSLESVARWVNCESTWAVVTAGNYLSLVQYLPSTWGHIAAITGYWDVYDPWSHGYNSAIWAGLSDPYQQWPSCWWQ